MEKWRTCFLMTWCKGTSALTVSCCVKVISMHRTGQTTAMSLVHDVCQLGGGSGDKIQRSNHWRERQAQQAELSNETIWFSSRMLYFHGGSVSNRSYWYNAVATATMMVGKVESVPLRNGVESRFLSWPCSCRINCTYALRAHTWGATCMLQLENDWDVPTGKHSVVIPFQRRPNYTRRLDVASRWSGLRL